MTKKELVDRLAESFDLTKKVAEGVIIAVIEGIHEGTARDGISRMGKHIFKRVTRKARVCRNPRTGEDVNVPEKSYVVYRKAI